MIDTKFVERERTRQGLTQEQLSEKIGISANAYRTLIKKKSAHPKTIKAIIKALGVDPRDVVPEPVNQGVA